MTMREITVQWSDTLHSSEQFTAQKVLVYAREQPMGNTVAHSISDDGIVVI